MAFPGLRPASDAAPALVHPLEPDPDLDPDVDRLGSSSTLDDLFAASPVVPARTTLPALLGVLTGVGSLLVSLWTVGAGLATVAAALAVVLCVVGLAKASRPGVAGGACAAVGLVAALLTGASIGLRYLGVDTAVAGDLSLRPLLEWLTALLPPV